MDSVHAVCLYSALIYIAFKRSCCMCFTFFEQLNKTAAFVNVFQIFKLLMHLLPIPHIVFNITVFAV